jgi:glucan-binding YG repeat protein
MAHGLPSSLRTPLYVFITITSQLAILNNTLNTYMQKGWVQINFNFGHVVSTVNHLDDFLEDGQWVHLPVTNGTAEEIWIKRPGLDERQCDSRS